MCEFGSAHERETQQDHEHAQQRNPCWKGLLSGRGVETGVLSGRERRVSLPRSCTQVHAHKHTHTHAAPQDPQLAHRTEAVHCFYVTQQRQEVHWPIHHLNRSENLKTRHVGLRQGFSEFQWQSEHSGRSALEYVYTQETRSWSGNHKTFSTMSD